MNEWAQAYYGGSRNNGANAGLGALNLNDAAANANSNIGARLANETGQMSRELRLGDQRPSFGACVLSVNALEDQQPSAAQHRVAGGDLFARIASYENLVAAYHEARRGKRYSQDALAFSDRWEERLIELHEHLLWRSWQPGKPRVFTVRDPKMRDITAPPFADRVIHHALVRIINPLFERRFIQDSYACRVDKGAQRAVMRVRHFLRVAKRNWGDGIYVLKADISKYFASIRHDVLMGEVERVIADPGVLWLWKQILRGYGYESGIGLPVGALTSQLAANIVLDRLDHAAKDDMGIRFYARYMDDFVAVLPDKATAQKVMSELGEAVNGLALSLNPKTAVHPWQRGVDFCGYRIWPTHILPRKRNIKRARLAFKKMASQYRNGDVDLDFVRQRVMSFLAYTKHCSASRTVEGVLGDLVLVKNSAGASHRERRAPRPEGAMD